MPDIGWMELLVIGVVALIVVGPKDLPKMFLKLGQMTGRVRAMARDFQSAMNQAAEESGMGELNRDLKSASKFTNPRKMARDIVGGAFEDIDPTKFEEGTETRIIAEKKALAQKAARERAEAKRAERVASGAAKAAPAPVEPPRPAAEAEPAPAEPAAETRTS